MCWLKIPDTLSCKFPHLGYIPLIIPSFINGSFTNKRESGKDGMAKKVPEPVFTDKSHPDVFVPVKPASPVTFRIIQVDDFEISDTNVVFEL